VALPYRAATDDEKGTTLIHGSTHVSPGEGCAAFDITCGRFAEHLEPVPRMEAMCRPKCGTRADWMVSINKSELTLVDLIIGCEMRPGERAAGHNVSACSAPDKIV
jgi:hypothetical protein